MPNRGYCVYYPLNIFCNTYGFENWGISSVIPQLQLGNIWSCEEFRSIAHERKYLMDYKYILLDVLLCKGGKFLEKLWCCVGGSITR